jgi:hypothetical protein
MAGAMHLQHPTRLVPPAILHNSNVIPPAFSVPGKPVSLRLAAANHCSDRDAKLRLLPEHRPSRP